MGGEFSHPEIRDPLPRLCPATLCIPQRVFVIKGYKTGGGGGAGSSRSQWRSQEALHIVRNIPIICRDWSGVPMRGCKHAARVDQPWLIHANGGTNEKNGRRAREGACCTRAVLHAKKKNQMPGSGTLGPQQRQPTSNCCPSRPTGVCRRSRHSAGWKKKKE